MEKNMRKNLVLLLLLTILALSVIPVMAQPAQEGWEDLSTAEAIVVIVFGSMAGIFVGIPIAVLLSEIVVLEIKGPPIDGVSSYQGHTAIHDSIPESVNHYDGKHLNARTPWLPTFR